MMSYRRAHAGCDIRPDAKDRLEYCLPADVTAALEIIYDYADNNPIAKACIKHNEDIDNKDRSHAGIEKKRFKKQLKLIYRKICKDHFLTNSKREIEYMAHRAGVYSRYDYDPGLYDPTLKEIGSDN